MNFAEPSGSSPPEKPPGSAIIWLRPIASTNRSTLSSISCAVRFLITKISVSAPSRLNARAVSYSQFVPGNTGINTCGVSTV